MIGTVDTAEFFPTTAVSAGFLAALLTGHWEERAISGVRGTRLRG